ncbi:MAG TPA: hypothetical protein ENH05_05850 [Rhizobiales bacterium]|nr:hypothetical protein BMS3Bbin10_00410 [bacterium BMS3Bbin10]HDO52244.1 hypothetical protein [Hyphomicrobiales bacterium]
MSRVVVFLVQRKSGDRLKPRATRPDRARHQALPKQIARYIFVLLLLPLVLSACAIEGDFGRPQPTIFDRVADEFLSSKTTLLGSRGGSGVTDDEMAMREAGYRLSSPLNPSPQGAAGPYGGSGYGGYGARPGSGPVGHPLAAIEGELKRDHQMLTQFGIASRRVLVTDSRRMQAVYENDPNLLVEDKRSSRDRMRENFSFIESTFEDFGRRLKAYYYAIDEVRTNAPDAFTVELEGSLSHLRDRSASLEYELTRYFGVAVARGEYQPPRFASRERPRYGPPVPYRRSDQPVPYSFK